MSSGNSPVRILLLRTPRYERIYHISSPRKNILTYKHKKKIFSFNLARSFVGSMPAGRRGREGDALNDATDPLVSSAELPTTRLGLVREALPTSKSRRRRGTIHDSPEEVDGADARTGMTLGPVCDEPQGQSVDHDRRPMMGSPCQA
jgi:hypothetical protein